jgi:hypothetical protein
VVTVARALCSVVFVDEQLYPCPTTGWPHASALGIC